MTHTTRNSERGQALLEALVGLPALGLLLAVFVVALAMFALRIHLVFLTQELATCTLSLKPLVECEQQARRQTQGLLEHGGFHDIQVQAQAEEPEARLAVRARWGVSPCEWSLHWRFRETVPFNAQN